jgi:hypothetical protein
MATNKLPLPLQLVEPVLLVADRGEQFRNEYDPKAQLCSNTKSTQNCKTRGHHGLLQDVTVDVQVDDVIA